MLNSSTFVTTPLSFFQRGDVVQIAKEMIGMYLIHDDGDEVVGGRIVETEAYCGTMDRACHAFGKRTPRTEVMYGDGGTAYIYLCYGMYHLFNVVTNKEGSADAVLIRAIEPLWGIETMRLRTGKKEGIVKLASGPGLVGKAMNFHRDQSGEILGESIQVLKSKEELNIVALARKRVGVDYAGEDALLPWRFILKDNNYVSRK